MSTRLERSIRRRLEGLPRGLQDHLCRVEQVATELARVHHIDEDKVRLGALAHDIARATPGDELLRQANELGIAVHPVEARVPILLHGPVAAELLSRVDGLEDRDIYEAVYWHSTAHKSLGATGKVVFLADKLDPHKTARDPFLAEISDLAQESLDRAILEFLTRELTSLLKGGSLVHPVSVEARNCLILEQP